MADLRWDDVSELFEPDGALLDAYVFGTTVTDWQAFIDLTRSRGWEFNYLEDGRSTSLPGRVEAVFERQSETGLLLQINLGPEIWVNVHFFQVKEIEVDFLPEELQGQERLDVVCDFLRAVSRHLGKPMVLTPENLEDKPLIGYDASSDRVVRLRS